MFAHCRWAQALARMRREVMHHACAVPLNPNFTEAELVLALEQLKCSALVTVQGHVAQAAGQELGLRILLVKGGPTIKLEGERAGKVGAVEPQGSMTWIHLADLFIALHCPALPCQERGEAPADLHRTVLLLKTSGTTSKGKVVPFSMRRLCLHLHVTWPCALRSLAAQYNARGLELQAGSVCLSPSATRKGLGHPRYDASLPHRGDFGELPGVPQRRCHGALLHGSVRRVPRPLIEGFKG